MANLDPEAQRMADELQRAKAEVDERRQADLRMLREEEQARAREQGKREGLQEAHNRETLAKFERINGSIDRTAAGLAKLEAAVLLIPSAMRDLIAEALEKQSKALEKRSTEAGSKRLTRLEIFISAVVACVVLGTFILALVTALSQ